MSWHLKICVTPFFSVDTGDPKFKKSTLFIPPNEFAKLRLSNNIGGWARIFASKVPSLANTFFLFLSTYFMISFQALSSSPSRHLFADDGNQLLELKMSGRVNMRMVRLDS